MLYVASGVFGSLVIHVMHKQAASTCRSIFLQVRNLSSRKVSKKNQAKRHAFQGQRAGREVKQASSTLLSFLALGFGRLLIPMEPNLLAHRAANCISIAASIMMPVYY